MTRISTPWLTSPAVEKVMQIFASAGVPAYFVGGCVRNALLGVPVTDLDISTPIRPEMTMKIAQEAGLRVAPTGIDHGTVTVVADGEPFEITTFRKDVETDGRRAVVAFAETLEEDARRRDFTMNALYADATGLVVDPLGGMADLEARCVRFIDDPETRIREDYLRILRFFRFFAWYGDQQAGLDADGLAACAALVGGLEGLSRERVGAEMIKLLSAFAPQMAVAAMEQSGVLSTLLPGATTKAFFLLTEFEEQPDPIRRLAALGDFDVTAALRLSKAQSRAYDTLRAHATDMTSSVAELAYREGPKPAKDIALLRAAFLEQVPEPGLAQEIVLGAEAKFPLSAADLMPDLEGVALGRALKQAERAWIDSRFTLDRDALLTLAKGG